MIFCAIWKGICYFLLVINSNLGPISHRFRYIAIYSLKPSIENCDQTAADGDLLLTVRRKLPSPYPMVPSPTPYSLPFSHSTARFAYTIVRYGPSRSSNFSDSRFTWKPICDFLLVIYSNLPYLARSFIRSTDGLTTQNAL